MRCDAGADVARLLSMARTGLLHRLKLWRCDPLRRWRELVRHAGEAWKACAVYSVARVKALRPTASAGVGGAAVLQLDGLWYGDGLAPRGLVVASLRSAGAAASAPPSIRGSVERGATSAPPSPSRHDPWPFLRCVWICVIAIAIMRTQGGALVRAGSPGVGSGRLLRRPSPRRRRGMGPGL